MDRAGRVVRHNASFARLFAQAWAAPEPDGSRSLVHAVGERDRAQLGAGETDRLGLRVANRVGDGLSERRQQLGPRLEAVLVEVVRRAPARAQDEIALEVGVLAQRRRQLGALH